MGIYWRVWRGCGTAIGKKSWSVSGKTSVQTGILPIGAEAKQSHLLRFFLAHTARSRFTPHSHPYGHPPGSSHAPLVIDHISLRVLIVPHKESLPLSFFFAREDEWLDTRALDLSTRGRVPRLGPSKGDTTLPPLHHHGYLLLRRTSQCPFSRLYQSSRRDQSPATAPPHSYSRLLSLDCRCNGADRRD